MFNRAATRPPSSPAWRKFLVALFLLGSPCAAAEPKSCACADPYLTRAIESYQSLQLDIQQSSNYWQVGNVVDTMFDFIAMPQLSDAQAALYLQMPRSDENLFPNCSGTLASYVACQYSFKTAGSLWWYDDWSWWGIASSKAFLDEPRYRRVFGASAADFQKIARSTWDIAHRGFDDGVHRGGPNVWENRENQLGYREFQPPFGCQAGDTLLPPRFPGGVWQFELYTNPRTSEAGWTGPRELSAVATGNPNIEVLGPFQNAVTNGLYFNHAQRLLEHDPLRREEYARATASELGFLRQWFAYDHEYQLPSQAGPSCPRGAGCSNATALLQIFPPAANQSGKSALVTERVSTYAAPALGADFPPVRGWYKDVFWTGDQGLMLGGLIDYARAHPEDAMSREVAALIVKGVMRQLAGNDGALEPYSPLAVDPPRDPTPGTVGDPGDYKSGNGIFMRYLLYAYQAKFPGWQPNPITEVVNGKEFQKFLAASAKDAYCSFSQWGDLFDHFNVLATMVTARQLLSDLPTQPPACP